MESHVEVRVQLVGYMSKSSGRTELTLSLPSGSTLEHVIREIVNRVPGSGIALESGRVTGCLLVLNDEHVGLPDGIRRTVRDGDELVIIPPVAGGMS